MFFEGIRSERLLMCHAADRLSVRWYLGYDLNEPLPDHSSLTRIRERYGIGIFRRFFEAIVEQCQQAGLDWGRELYFDGTKVAANAGKESLKPRFAVEAHLNGLFNAEAVERIDEEEQQIPQEEPAGSDSLVQLPVSLSPAAYEELSQHNTERHDWTRVRGSTGSPRDWSQLSAYRRPPAQHDGPRCDAHAKQRRSRSGLSYPLCGGWRQGPRDSGGVGNALRSDGQSTDARPALAYTLPLEAVAATSDR
jgi:Transposase domain (DUF772)